MRIGVDIRSLLSPTGRGVSHYTASLLAELTRRHRRDEWILFSTGRRRPEVPLSGPHVRIVHADRPNKLMNTAFAAGVRRIERHTGPLDVFFAPNLGFVSLGATPLVVTVHDLSFERMPEAYRWRERLWHRFVRPRRLLERAGRIIAVSDQTRRELRGLYGLPDRKITVIHSGIDPIYRRVSPRDRERVRRRYRLPSGYFLYLGVIEPRKEIPTLLAGFGRARKDGLRSGLVLAGAGRTVRAPGVRSLGYVREEDKPGLYAGATAVVLVSRHEGFGFPPLEALAAGTPSLVSDLPIFRETLGAGALRVPVGQSVAVAAGLLRLERDAGFRKCLVARGRPRLDRYRWRRTADRTYDVLREVADAG